MKLSKRLGWVILLFASGASQADMLAGLKAYEQKKYEEAQQHFAGLLPLGNELAAYNLGAMAYQGEGQPQDLVSAIAYFGLAADQGYSQADVILQQISPQATAEQLQQAAQYLVELKQQRVINLPVTDYVANEPRPDPIKKVHPVYPKEAAFKGVFGYSAMRFIIDKDGNVATIDILDEYPSRVFSRVSRRALSRWKFPASDQQQLGYVSLEYLISDSPSVGPDNSCSKVEPQIKQHQLWQHAVNGSPEHQLVLGTLLELCRLQSRARFRLDHSAALTQTMPDLSIFTPQQPPKISTKAFYGKALVKVDDSGTVQQEFDVELLPGKAVSSLIGARLSGGDAANLYQVKGTDEDGSNLVTVMPVHTIEPGLSGRYWWQQAARNGNHQAQRIMAGYDLQWEQYLVLQQDPQTMAWAGVRLMTEGKREQGMALLEQAIAKNYAPAKEMKQQFM
ncbi:energy transducer TonB [Rheinheimera gaetbuli]